jgi:ATP-dependent Lon protease
MHIHQPIKDLAAQIIQLSPNMPTEASIILKNIENASFLINFVSSNINSELTEKQVLLETDDVKLRAEKLIHLLQRELQFAELKNKVTNKTRTEIDKQQREYFLQQQMKSIKEELGGDSNEREVAQMKKKAEAKNGLMLQRACSNLVLKNWSACIQALLIILLFITILILCLIFHGKITPQIIMILNAPQRF